ncbi:MAG: GNAT family N-acetyltransferase [Frankiaceae bacterium]|nr:GNAT family N-acetyltransferase [Frankiaceae bacterium]MBV9872974.1 GNAT family N-acetyltransferase [Frankiaceae bacterium]
MTLAADDDVTIEPADATSDEVGELLASYLAEINAAFGYDKTRDAPAEPDHFTPPQGLMLVVRDGAGVAKGCGAIRLLDPATAEIKRMWLHPSMRGRGAGWRLLTELERQAVVLGATRGVLDTNETLTSALALYRAAGWAEVPQYNDNDQATHWFAKDLAGD